MANDYSQRRKELRYLKAINPDYASIIPNGEVQDHIRFLESYGWTQADIGRRAGLNSSVVNDQVVRRSRCHADIAAAILGVKLTALDHETGPGLTAWGRCLGSHRIVTGLQASGWTYPALSAQTDGWGPECLRRYGQVPKESRRSHISKERYLELREIAHRVESLDPVADGGADPMASRSARAKARNRGYPPIGCWDLETVHLPDSIPEWTGACGTDEGYAIHLREEIPVCPACEAVEGRSHGQGRGKADGGRFSSTKFRILMEQRGLSVPEAADAIGVSDDCIRRWAGGQRTPGEAKYVDRICSAFDCFRSELFDMDGEEVFYDQDFNRHVFNEIMDRERKTTLGLSREVGVSNMAVYYWRTGRNIPKIPKIVKAAEVLGVDWQEFYR
jgi:transcriptional regulator with XRE-family HTH domain